LDYLDVFVESCSSYLLPKLSFPLITNNWTEITIRLISLIPRIYCPPIFQNGEWNRKREKWFGRLSILLSSISHGIICA
jgi:hypothetical protein